MEIRDAEAFVVYWRNIRKRTRRVVDCIPHDRFDWSHDEGAWTLADLVRHLAAIERWMFAENAQGLPSRYPGHERALADGPGQVVAYMHRMHEESCAIFGALSPEQLDSKCITPGGAKITVWKWLRAMVEHECHHRGQIHMMVSMLGVDAPPLYGLTEEEVEARSRVESGGAATSQVQT
ncbi:MAG: DinB family protein [Gemmatimonadota bacterium]|nr:DinB family protein [Gemmatimonadota bacterium]